MANNNTNKEKKGMKGIFIPIEIFENADLNLAEKLLYGMIWYYSTYGSGCRISADNLGRKLDASERTIKRYRQHLKELNLVRSEGYGEKTVYYANDTKVDPKSDPNIDNDNEVVTSSECTKVDPKSDTKLNNDTHSDTGDTPLRVTGDTNLRVTGDTHNKELNEELNNIHDNVSLNMVKSNLNNSNMEVKEHLVTESDSTYEEQFSSTVKNGKVKNVQSLGVGHCHFFKSVYERGVNEKLIENFAKLERKEQYDFLWSKWRTFMNGFSDSDISFGTVYDCFKTFLWMVGKVYNTPSKVKERKSALTHDFKLKLKAFYLNQWKRFLNMVDELDNQDCKDTRLAFYDMVVKVYDDDEERQKTLSQMEVEYAIAYQATDKWSNPKLEELDPDLMYQNLSDGEVEETEVFEGETQVTGETDGDTSNRVYDKWYGVWRKLLKEVSNSNGKLTIDEHTTVAIMEKAEADELPYGWRQKLKEAMEEDLEQFNRKTCVSDPVSNG